MALPAASRGGMNLRAKLAQLFVGMPPPKVPALPSVNPLTSDESREALRNTALRLTDPDVHAYLVLTVHQTRVFGENRAEIELAGDGVPEYWPAIAETLARILVTGQE